MSILAVLFYTTIEMNAIEFLICIVAACSLGYEIGRKKISKIQKEKEI
jgi:hypothetical protein